MMRAAVWAAIIACWSSAAAAQDVLSVGQGIYRQVLDNPRVRVLQATFKPGAKVGAHSHPDHILYMLTEGTLIIRPPGKTAYDMNFTPGQALFLPAQTRAAENGGEKTVQTLVVELKSASAGAVAKARTSRRVASRRSARRR
jgi:beta-alanine degradation protein BauB